MSETGDKVVSDEEVLCASCGHTSGCHPGFRSCRAGLCRCGSFVKLHRPEKVAFEAQHRPASQLLAVEGAQENEPPICARCGDEYMLKDFDYEPTKYCDACAHIRVEELESVASIKPEAPEGAKVFTAEEVLLQVDKLCEGRTPNLAPFMRDHYKTTGYLAFAVLTDLGLEPVTMWRKVAVREAGK